MPIETMLRENLKARAEQLPPPGAVLQPFDDRQRSMRKPWALALSLVVVALLAVPFLFTNTGAETEVSVLAPELSAVSFGDREAVRSIGERPHLAAAGGSLYGASLGGSTDRVMRSTDDGQSWEAVLEETPGDSEGRFGVGRFVVQVIEDDSPARGTVEPSSVVTGPLVVNVFDPATGATVRAVLPRPDDPEMVGLALDGSESDCPLGGYQSWVRASGVAVGDRIAVSGTQMLVGQLPDGTVLCGGGGYHTVWVSDDGGATWTMHDAPALSSITWTGQRFVAWSDTSLDATIDSEAARTLVVSDDGVEWEEVLVTPGLPGNSLLADINSRDITASGDNVIALYRVFEWSLSLPENVTDPEQLREPLRWPADRPIEELFDLLGVDLPLDGKELRILARFAGTSSHVGSVAATSHDGGATWSALYIDRPLTGVAAVGDVFIGVESSLKTGVESSPETDRPASLVVSTNGSTWESVLELPGNDFYSDVVAGNNAIFVVSGDTGRIWRIPIN